MQRLSRQDNVSTIHLNNNDASAERKFKNRVKTVHYHRMVALGAILAVVCIFFGTQVYQVQEAQANTQTQLKQDQKRYRNVKAKRSELKNEVKQLHDNEYLDNLIRYKFNYSKKGEVIYNVPEQANKNLNF